MMPRLKLLGLAVVLLLAQELATVSLPELVRPDLVLVFALAMGLRSRGTEGLVLSFAAGFAVDALSGSPLGLHALLCGSGCALTRLLDGALYLRAPAPWAAYAAGYALLNTVLFGLAIRAMVGDGAVPWAEILLRAPGAALATGIIAAPLFPLLERVDADPDRDARWVSLDPRSARQ